MDLHRLELVYSGLMVGVFATELEDFAIDLRTQFLLFSLNPSYMNQKETTAFSPPIVSDSSSILFDLVLKNLDSHLSFFEYRMMSSGYEDSSVNTMRIRGIPEQCGCGLRTGIYTSKTKDHLYKWVDEAVYEEVQDALPKVECFASDVMKIKMEIESMKTVEEELK
uniref:Uncharacterized protein n=1 Tax=Brassica oleracea var. oleracea TaxID=109376 RepID=A0A0D3AK27_BRAOL